MDYISTLLAKNGLVVAFLVTGIVVFLSDWLSKKLTNNKLPGSAIAIFSGLVLAYIGGSITGGNSLDFSSCGFIQTLSTRAPAAVPISMST